MPLIRGLEQLIADLDRRARPDARNRNQVIAKFQALQDTVSFSSDTMTVTNTTTPYRWAAAASTAQTMIWSAFEWS